ncbi:hypothetical protein ABBQ38_007606 [Trebouxia sp. C0009 RCD-2024]
MSSQTQVENVQQQIEGVAQEVSEMKASLSAAKQAGDGEEVNFLRTQLDHLYKKELALRKEKNLWLQAQQGGLGHVVFKVTGEQGEFTDYAFELPTFNDQVLLKDVEKQLDLHRPPLRLRTVNNVPAAARPSNKTLAVDLKDGDRLQLVAEIAPGECQRDVSIDEGAI